MEDGLHINQVPENQAEGEEQSERQQLLSKMPQQIQHNAVNSIANQVNGVDEAHPIQQGANGVNPVEIEEVEEPPMDPLIRNGAQTKDQIVYNYQQNPKKRRHNSDDINNVADDNDDSQNGGHETTAWGLLVEPLWNQLLREQQEIIARQYIANFNENNWAENELKLKLKLKLIAPFNLSSNRINKRDENENQDLVADQNSASPENNAPDGEHMEPGSNVNTSSEHVEAGTLNDKCLNSESVEDEDDENQNAKEVSKAHQIEEIVLEEEDDIEGENDNERQLQPYNDQHGVFLYPDPNVNRPDYIYHPHFAAHVSTLHCTIQHAWNLHFPPDEEICNNGIALHRRDFLTLRPYQYLNDNIVDSYLDMIMRRSFQDEWPFPKVFTLSTLEIANKLMRRDFDGMMRAVRRREAAFDASNIIILPLNTNSHWYLCIAKKETKEIVIINSMSFFKNDHPTTENEFSAASAIVDWFKFIQFQRGENAENWTVGVPPDVPQQLNEFDCGVFALESAEQFSRKIERPVFTQDDIMEIRERMVFELITDELQEEEEEDEEEEGFMEDEEKEEEEGEKEEEVMKQPSPFVNFQEHFPNQLDSFSNPEMDIGGLNVAQPQEMFVNDFPPMGDNSEMTGLFGDDEPKQFNF